MNSQRATIEIIAPTINEAIEKGLADLELTRDEVDIEILDEGSRGLFGLGSHQARVRLVVKQTMPEAGKEEVSSASSEEEYIEEAQEEPTVKPIRIPPANAKEEIPLHVGKRSETLNALQYISRLIVSKELGENVTLVIDVEGYRSRRERQLRQLAHRMAEQAVKTGRKQILEPMPPNERRIIHMELREDAHVTTESFGEEPHRKVSIIPKE
jgi:spoIIIJ-associated protein